MFLFLSFWKITKRFTSSPMFACPSHFTQTSHIQTSTSVMKSSGYYSQKELKTQTLKPRGDDVHPALALRSQAEALRKYKPSAQEIRPHTSLKLQLVKEMWIELSAKPVLGSQAWSQINVTHVTSQGPDSPLLVCGTASQGPACGPASRGPWVTVHCPVTTRHDGGDCPHFCRVCKPPQTSRPPALASPAQQRPGACSFLLQGHPGARSLQRPPQVISTGSHGDVHPGAKRRLVSVRHF